MSPDIEMIRFILLYHLVQKKKILDKAAAAMLCLCKICWLQMSYYHRFYQSNLLFPVEYCLSSPIHLHKPWSPLLLPLLLQQQEYLHRITAIIMLLLLLPPHPLLKCSYQVHYLRNLISSTKSFRQELLITKKIKNPRHLHILFIFFHFPLYIHFIHI